MTVALALLIALTACAEGTAHDAERGKQEDAQRTSVMESVQETYTVNILKSTPLPPTATQSP